MFINTLVEFKSSSFLPCVYHLKTFFLLFDHNLDSAKAPTNETFYRLFAVLNYSDTNFSTPPPPDIYYIVFAMIIHSSRIFHFLRDPPRINFNSRLLRTRTVYGAEEKPPPKNFPFSKYPDDLVELTWSRSFLVTSKGPNFVDTFKKFRTFSLSLVSKRG